jgi:glycosyltransferase involved in cell wall biosynthesis
MPTRDRRAFVLYALDYFLRQDYPDRELIVVDDGADRVSDLIPNDDRIRYFPLDPAATIGAKRNYACQRARGVFILHWDDDDWHARDRISRQVETLVSTQADVCGIETPLFFDAARRTGWKFTYKESLPWVAGNSLGYRRDFWERTRFENLNVGEDNAFIQKADPARIASLPSFEVHVGMVHSSNTSPKRTTDTCWQPFPIEEMRRVLGEDWARYVPTPRAEGTPEVLPARGEQPERRIDTIAVARNEDLDLPEFVAYRSGVQLSWMRRWELPYALHQARLQDNMAVLDCTINPAGFEGRLRSLYPHILYQHASPIRNGAFARPIGLPDGRFDRVVCVNTLEHLLRPQREVLMADMAAKLKPGGLLILTSDFYFESCWQDPAFLSTGLMRSDGEEVFSGFNRADFREWVRLCSANGLGPLGPDAAPDPEEGDPRLYRNVDPFIHACIGGVFAKEGATPHFGGRRVLLALLTWNTREVSIESLQALVREAHMLRRLGQTPIICVCDNGSTDGTAEAEEEVLAQVDVQNHRICNPVNLGNSIARNQMLQHMRACDADYVLFMDGDIEVVPFSSFAMMRYLESQGRQLGCVGAHSWGQSRHRSEASQCLFAIEPAAVKSTSIVAWTQYGMFRREVFDEGIRFDETPPFDGPGWGFEDNDLAFQMEMRGFANHYFEGMTYLHRDLRSSTKVMAAQGLDPVLLSERRRSYLIDKWAGVPDIDRGPLAEVRCYRL